MDLLKDRERIPRWKKFGNNFVCFNDAMNMFFSNILGSLIITSVGVLFVIQLISGSSQQLLTVGLPAFAIAGALSGLCYRLASNLTEEMGKNSPLYAGDKFFHSCLLIVEIIFLKYIKDYLSLRLVTWFFNIIVFPISITIGAVGVCAVFFFLKGFDTINDFFWKRHKEKGSV